MSPRYSCASACGPVVLLLLVCLSATARSLVRSHPGSKVLLQRQLRLDLLDLGDPRRSNFEVDFKVDQEQGVGQEEQEDEEDQERSSLELLRFITPYGTFMEALVDVTPYSQLLQSSLESLSDIEFYAAIDTWVTNDTSRNALYMNNLTNSCTPLRVSEGNGWNVSLEIVLWPRASSVESAAVRPRATVVLAGGYPASVIDFGTVTIHEGILEAGPSPSKIELDGAADLSTAGFDPRVYACPDGASSLQRASLWGYLAKQGQLQAASKTSGEGASSGKKEADLEEEFVEFVADMVPAEVTAVHKHSGTFEVKLMGNATLEPGMPVYFGSGGTFSDQLKSPGKWWNLSLPFEPMGYVASFSGSNFVVNVTSHQCFAATKLNASSIPALQVPRDSKVLSTAKKQVHAAMQSGMSSHGKQKEDSQELSFLDFVGTGNESNLTFVACESLGRVSRDGGKEFGTIALNVSVFGGDASQVSGGNASKVCVVKQLRSGHILDRSFRASLDVGERALLHLTATGHGWSATSEQCGEYCHAVYHVSLNGQSAANVTQWRDDCHLNPSGPRQHGTWDESRNGWCPGSVEPGLFLDVTYFLNEPDQDNLVEIEVAVWIDATHKYKPYSDESGFVLGDKASLAVSMSLLLYGRDAVEAALSKGTAFTAAEEALQKGSSDKAMLSPPEVVKDLNLSNLTQALSTTTASPSSANTGIGGEFDFRSRAPWYFYNESVEGAPGKQSGAVAVSIFKDRLMQADSRMIQVAVDRKVLEAAGAGPAGNWGQIALRLRLQKPSGLDYDHWDRIASVGIKLPRDVSNVKLRTSSKPQLRKLWELKNKTPEK